MTSAKESTRSVLKVGRTTTGYVVRIEGRGSVHESPGLKALALEALDASPATDLTVDLSDCEYLDSTFLGCLVGLHSRFNARSSDRRLRVAGSDEGLERLFGPTGLERILPRHEGGSSDVQTWLNVPAAELDRAELGRHLIECHRRLAEVGGPEAGTFTAIADQIERELEHDRR